jgi:hypothetical protein
VAQEVGQDLFVAAEAAVAMQFESLDKSPELSLLENFE